MSTNYVSSPNVLPGRVTSIDSAQELAERMKRANDALSDLRNKVHLRELMENDESAKNLSPVLKEVIMSGGAFNLSNPTDAARHAVCAFVLGVNQGIAKMFEATSKEAFLAMDVDKMTELSRKAAELSKEFAQAFPFKSK